VDEGDPDSAWKSLWLGIPKTQGRGVETPQANVHVSCYFEETPK
jgi:hypothetical protein